MAREGFEDYFDRVQRVSEGGQTNFGDAVADFRNHAFFLAQGKAGRNRRDFEMRVRVSGDPMIVTTYELWQDVGDEFIRIIPSEGQSETFDRREFFEELEDLREAMRE